MRALTKKLKTPAQEPKLLEKTEIVRERRKLAITKYSWLDEDTKIRIYIPIEDGRFQQPGIIEPSQAALRDGPGRQPLWRHHREFTSAALPTRVQGE